MEPILFGNYYKRDSNNSVKLCAHVQDLHGSRDAFSVAEDLVEIFCSQDVSERRLGEKSGGVMGIFHIGDRYSCI